MGLWKWVESNPAMVAEATKGDPPTDASPSKDSDIEARILKATDTLAEMGHVRPKARWPMVLLRQMLGHCRYRIAACLPSGAG